MKSSDQTLGQQTAKPSSKPGRDRSQKKKKKIYLPKRLVARKGFTPSTLATVHTIKQK